MRRVYAICLATFTLCSACPLYGQDGPDLTRYMFSSKHMGTEFRIVLYAESAEMAEKTAQAAFQRVEALNQVLSDYSQTSEMMRLCLANDQEPGVPRKVSEDLFRVLTESQKLSRKSDGAFDVTVGPVVRLWRIARRTQQLPSDTDLAEAMANVGYDKLMLDEKKRTVTLTKPGMRLDFGGIGKGFAADEALKLLAEHGIKRALVAASGDIRCGESPPGEKGWEVEIPPITQGEPTRELRLENAAVSTSGDLFQFVEINGVRYSHLLDPKTGIGLTGRRSVTVIAPTGTQADSMTKAVSILPLDKALALVENTPGTACFLAIQESDDSPVKTARSKQFSSFERN